MVAITDNVFVFSHPPVIEYWPLVLLLIGTMISGVLIGAIGVGGVAIVPMLLFFGVDGKIAVTSAMFAYIWVAISAIVMHSLKTRFDDDNKRQLVIMCSAAFPTAVLAGYVLTLVSASVAVVICAATALATSLKNIVEFAQLKSREKGTRCCGADSADALVAGKKKLANGDTSPEDKEDGVDDEEALRRRRSSDADGGGLSTRFSEESSAQTAAAATSPQKTESRAEAAAEAAAAANHLEAKRKACDDGGGNCCGCMCSAVTVDSAVFVYLGVLTGFGSGLTGTSGPVVSLPQMFLIRPLLPTATAVAYSVVVQLPVALGSTVGNLAFGQLDLGLGACLRACVRAWLRVFACKCVASSRGTHACARARHACVASSPCGVGVRAWR
jgi:uncharacterized membrane protein YfcA